MWKVIINKSYNCNVYQESSESSKSEHRSFKLLFCSNLKKRERNLIFQSNTSIEFKIEIAFLEFFSCRICAFDPSSFQFNHEVI